MSKKRIFLSGGVILLAVVLTAIAFFSFRRPDTYQLALDNIAEARFYLKTAQADNPIGVVHLYSGLRETDYQADGIATETKPFTVLSVEPKDSKVVYNGCITAEVKINNDKPITLILEKNPYGNNYAVDLEQALDVKANVTVTFKTANETVGVTELKNAMPDNAITWETALEIASQTLAGNIDTHTRLETTTKILCDHTTADTPYWFVSFITEAGNRYFVVISPTGTVVGNSLD